MNPANYTSQASIVIQQAMEIAQERGQQAIETGHLMQAILQDETQTASFLLKKLGISPSQIQTILGPILNSYPKVSGEQPYASNSLQQALQRADKLKSDLGDSFVSVEVLFLSLVDGNDSVADALKKLGLTSKNFKQAIIELRGNRKVNDPHAEGTYQSLEKYGKNLNE
jgi:ATP-dependent Clp protease ATP-binding subunit ClpB